MKRFHAVVAVLLAAVAPSGSSAADGDARPIVLVERGAAQQPLDTHACNAPYSALMSENVLHCGDNLDVLRPHVKDDKAGRRQSKDQKGLFE